MPWRYGDSWRLWAPTWPEGWPRGQAAALVTLRLTCADGGRLVRSRAHQPPLQASGAVTATVQDLLAALRPAAPVTEAVLTAGGLCVPPTHQQGLWDDGRGRSNAARLETVLAAHARRYGWGGLQRLRCDPTAPDGWRWLDLASADGPAGMDTTGPDKPGGRSGAAGRHATNGDVAGPTERRRCCAGPGASAWSRTWPRRGCGRPPGGRTAPTGRARTPCCWSAPTTASSPTERSR